MAAASGQVVAGSSRAGTGRERVLVVASDEGLLDLLRTTLGLAGYTVEHVGGGPQAVTRARSTPTTPSATCPTSGRRPGARWSAKAR